jgi:hypothetical protein
MGAEIRLMASHAVPVSVMPEELLRKMRQHRPGVPGFFREKVFIPRFALAAIVLLLLTAIPASWTLMRAQSSPLWFQFRLQPELTKGFHRYNVAQAGYEHRMAWMFLANKQDPLPSMIGARVAVKSVEDGLVEFEIAAEHFGKGTRLPKNMQEDVGKLKMRKFAYIPNQTLEIPLEGGGKLMLLGQVVDHKPKFAWGLPLEPGAGQLIIRSPVLLQDEQVVANLEGANATAEDESQFVFLSIPGRGRLAIGLREFPNAVQAEANWSYLKFKVDGKNYLLTAGAPISGGDQPRPVWVGLDPTITSEHLALGSGPM